MISGHQQQRTSCRETPWRRHQGLVVLCSMGILAVLLLVLSVIGDQGYFRIRHMERDRVALQQRVNAVREDNARLRRQLQEMKEGRASYELAAREKLGLVRPGEVVYDFRPDPLKIR